MDVHITGRHVDLTDELRTYMEGKIPRLEKHTDRLQSVEFVIEKSRFLHRAEVRLKAGTVGFTASETDPDPKRAFDLVIDKAERRLAKEMGVLNKNHRTRKPAKKTLGNMALEADDTIDVVIEEMEVGSRGRRRAAGGGDGGTTGANGRAARRTGANANGAQRVEHVWLEKLGLRVFAGGGVQADRMNNEEAAERLFFEDENFLCYTNSDTGRMNVIYRRKDGNFAIVEPAEK